MPLLSKDLPPAQQSWSVFDEHSAHRVRSECCVSASGFPARAFRRYSSRNRIDSGRPRSPGTYNCINYFNLPARQCRSFPFRLPRHALSRRVGLGSLNPDCNRRVVGSQHPSMKSKSRKRKPKGSHVRTAAGLNGGRISRAGCRVFVSAGKPAAAGHGSEPNRVARRLN